jgi:GH18 family chitinase
VNSGDLLGRYELVRCVGTGGLGEVWLANGPDGEVAVKVIRAELAERAGFRERLAAEAAAAQQAAGPGVVRLLRVETDGPTPYLVMEYLDHPDLAAMVAFRGPLTGSLLDTFADSLLEAMARIHRAGIVHRDLKPTNVLVDADGSAHVLDFGIATPADPNADNADSAVPESMGTVGWRAPEVQRGEPVTVAADVFGWGLLVAYAATGRHPFARDGGTEPVALQRNIASGAPTLDSLPEPLRNRVRDALADDVLRRRHTYVPSAFPTNPTEAPDTAVPGLTVSAPATPRHRRFGSLVIAGIVAVTFALIALVAVRRASTKAQGPIAAGGVVMGVYLAGGRSLDEVPINRLSHLTYGFLPLTTQGVQPIGPDAFRRDVARLAALRSRNSKARIILGVGGDSATLTEASKPDKVAVTARLAVEAMRSDRFDGIDLDWRTVTAESNESAQFVTLVRALRAELDRVGAAAGRTFTLGVHAGWLVDDPFNPSAKDQTPAEAADAVDYWELDADPMRGPWNCTGDASGGGTGFQSPLRPRAGDAFANNGIEPAVEGWRRLGVPSAKIVLIVPFHGRAFVNVPPGPNGDGIGQPCTNTGTSIEDRELSADEVRRAAGGPGANDHFDTASAAAYRYDPIQKVFVTFESAQSIEAKRAYVQTAGLAGVGAWDLSQDTTDFSLLQSLCACTA